MPTISATNAPVELQRFQPIASPLEIGIGRLEFLLHAAGRGHDHAEHQHDLEHQVVHRGEVQVGIENRQLLVRRHRAEWRVVQIINRQKKQGQSHDAQTDFDVRSGFHAAEHTKRAEKEVREDERVNGKQHVDIAAGKH